jgi:hypothetical protein
MFWFARKGILRRQTSPRPIHKTQLALEELEARLAPAVNVLGYHNDNASTGQNLGETALTPGNVNPTSFGKLFTSGVDGQVYAQPLVLTGVGITGGPQAGTTHDVVFVATEHDSLYAFDDNNGTLLWHDTLLPSRYGGTVTSVPSGDVNSGDLSPEIGITSTPVIDPSTNTIYVEEKTKEVENNNSHYLHWLHAINVGNGAERFVGPTLIADSIGDTYVSGPFVKGTSTDTPANTPPGGNVAFDALRQMNRVGLTLVNGNVYIAYASHGDNGPYHGWVLGFSAATLKPTAVFNTTPNASNGGIWQGGARLAADSPGNLYVETGNGIFDTTLDARGFPSMGDYGDSFLKLAVDPSSTQANQHGNLNGWGLKVVDYFTPMNQDSLNAGDTDLGSGGPFLLPDSAGSSAHLHLLVGSGKEGRIYLIDRDNMGKFDPNADRIVQELPPATISGSFGTGAYFNGQIYYVGGSNIGNPPDFAKTFSVSKAKLSTNPTSQGPDTFSFPGNTPTISANGSSNGIVWATDTGTNQLRAYDARNLATELYTSDQAANNRDQLGSAIKFAVTTVANGHVYVGTGAGATDALVAYGLLPNVSAQIQGTTLTLTKNRPGNITLTITRAGTFRQLTVVTGGTGTINNTLTTFTTPGPITSVVVNLGAGNDAVVLDGTAANGPFDLSGNLRVNGTGGNKTLTVLSTHLLAGGNLAISLAGKGAETATFTDVDVAGAATLTHPGTGNTSFTLNTSNNPNTPNRWGSLSISNGAGSDTNLLSDTDFAGSVNISNGPGDPANLGAGGGSQTTFTAVNHATLLHVSGNLAISTGGGQSDTEVSDYSVHGNVMIDTGPGIKNQTAASVIGIENNPHLPASAGPPVIGGAVILRATAPAGPPRLIINLGTGGPLTFEGNLSVSAGGTGSVTVTLQDLRVANGSTSVILGGQTSGDTVSVQGATITSLFNSFTLSSLATGSNTFSIQDQAGETDFGGAVNYQLTGQTNTLNLAADSNNTGGVSGAVVKLFGSSVFNGGAGTTNPLFEGSPGTNLLFSVTPLFSHFQKM